MAKLFVIIPAAGKGERMGPNSNKLFMEVCGIPVITRTLLAFENYKKTGVDVNAVVVTNESNVEPINDVISSNGITCVKKITLGGASRTLSVYNGLKALEELDDTPESDDIVFIHDGARCLATNEVFENCRTLMETHDVCVSGTQVKNTIKRVEDGIIVETLERSSLVEVQTPQSFKYDVLKRSYENAIDNNIEATDDTALAEILGYKVAIAPGSYENIKITTKEDILIAEGLLNKRG